MSKVHLGNGQHVDTMELVAKIRAFRGRLNRWEVCAELGCPNRTAWRVVNRLCQRYQIATRRRNGGVAVPPLAPTHPKPEAALQDAKRQLAHEIASYQRQLERGVGLPLFKPGPLEW